MLKDSMRNSRNCTHSVSRRIFIALGASTATTACSGKMTALKPPAQVPFLVEKAGNLVEIELNISEYRGYFFNLDFLYYRDDEADFLRVRKLIGSGEISRDGSPVDPGVPLRILLEIDGLDSTGEKVYYKNVRNPALVSVGSDHFTKRIDSIKLKRGVYKIRSESLLDVPEFNGVRVRFSINWHPKSTVISE